MLLRFVVSTWPQCLLLYFFLYRAGEVANETSLNVSVSDHAELSALLHADWAFHLLVTCVCFVFVFVCQCQLRDCRNLSFEYYCAPRSEKKQIQIVDTIKVQRLVGRNNRTKVVLLTSDSLHQLCYVTADQVAALRSSFEFQCVQSISFFGPLMPHTGRVTSSSAAEGWIAMQESKSLFVAPIFMATANPCITSSLAMPCGRVHEEN